MKKIIRNIILFWCLFCHSTIKPLIPIYPLSKTGVPEFKTYLLYHDKNKTILSIESTIDLVSNVYQQPQQAAFFRLFFPPEEQLREVMQRTNEFYKKKYSETQNPKYNKVPFANINNRLLIDFTRWRQTYSQIDAQFQEIPRDPQRQAQSLLQAKPEEKELYEGLFITITLVDEINKIITSIPTNVYTPRQLILNRYDDYIKLYLAITTLAQSLTPDLAFTPLGQEHLKYITPETKTWFQEWKKTIFIASAGVGLAGIAGLGLYAAKEGKLGEGVQQFTEKTFEKGVELGGKVVEIGKEQIHKAGFESVADVGKAAAWKVGMGTVTGTATGLAIGTGMQVLAPYIDQEVLQTQGAIIALPMALAKAAEEGISSEELTKAVEKTITIEKTMQAAKQSVKSSLVGLAMGVPLFYTSRGTQYLLSQSPERVQMFIKTTRKWLNKRNFVNSRVRETLSGGATGAARAVFNNAKAHARAEGSRTDRLKSFIRTTPSHAALSGTFSGVQKAASGTAWWTAGLPIRGAQWSYEKLPSFKTNQPIPIDLPK